MILNCPIMKDHGLIYQKQKVHLSDEGPNPLRIDIEI